MRYFEFVDDKSSKFWEIYNSWNTEPQYIETRFGRIGSDGRVSKIVYHTLKAGNDMEEKLIQQKLKKGYVEKSRPAYLRNVKIATPPAAATKPSSSGAPKKSPCPPGKIRNPKTGRCINDPSKKTASKKNTKPKETKTKKTPPAKKPCPPGKVRNPKTGRCINDPSLKKTTAPKKNTKKASVEKKPTTCAVPPSPKPKKSPPLPSSGACKSGNDGEMVYDVGKRGVMLAHVYKDDKGKIKTAPKGFPQAPVGWFLSEKFDGYRAIWDGKDFRSRNNKIFEAPRWFKDWLPAGIALDGELFLGRESFEQCGLFRRKVPNDDEWRHAQVKYQIFDAPSTPGVFEERQAFLDKLIKEKCKCVKTGDKCPLVLTKQTKVKDEAQVMKIYGDLLKKGAEGVMLRCPGSPYDAKRSSHLLKVKPHFDDECKIIGYKEGTGKYQGMLGAFKCELVKDPKIKFDTSGMNDEIRSNYKSTHPIGTIITFVHMGFMKSGAPRHPNYLRIRHSE